MHKTLKIHSGYFQTHLVTERFHRLKPKFCLVSKQKQMFYRRKRLVFAQFCTFLFIIFGRKLHIIAHYYIILRNFALNVLKQHTHRRKIDAPIYLRSAGQFSITIYRSIFRVCIRPTCQFWGLFTVCGSIFGSPPGPRYRVPVSFICFSLLACCTQIKTNNMDVRPGNNGNDQHS